MTTFKIIKYKNEQKKLSLTNGYWVCSNGYEWCIERCIPIHHIVFSKYCKKKSPYTHIHHCNGNKRDNSIDNLVSIPHELHAEIHRKYTQLPNKEKIEKKILPLFLKSKMTTSTEVKKSILEAKSIISKLKKIYESVPIGERSLIKNHLKDEFKIGASKREARVMQTKKGRARSLKRKNQLRSYSKK